MSSNHCVFAFSADYALINKQEGFEYKLFNQLVNSDDIPLPEQISFEVHWRTQMQTLSWQGRQKTAGELALLSTQLYHAGYRVISREDNVRCKHCTELTVVRFRCPIGPASMTAKVAMAMRTK